MTTMISSGGNVCRCTDPIAATRSFQRSSVYAHIITEIVCAVGVTLSLKRWCSSSNSQRGCRSAQLPRLNGCIWYRSYRIQRGCRSAQLWWRCNIPAMLSQNCLQYSPAILEGIQIACPVNTLVLEAGNLDNLQVGFVYA